jgi:hypothetical protein
LCSLRLCVIIIWCGGEALKQRFPLCVLSVFIFLCVLCGSKIGFVGRVSNNKINGLGDVALCSLRLCGKK